ncbi:hypothetical protein [Stenotrophomonas acidaminiphila]|uniref:hypothetical protein n=1 Tax=Stenotrophomonas acidaminiphila TaxID=128780 RepID=UPI0028AA0686|nr:hypothetical protein [Stenotrophomonas acidaminiphila]
MASERASEPTLTEIGEFLKRCDPRLVCEYLDDDVTLSTALAVHLGEAPQAAAAQEAVGEVAEWEGSLCVQWVPNYEPPVGTKLFAAPVTAAPAEMSPEFTDTARAAIAWVLWHHQGASSPVGQPLRFALGMGADEPLPDWRIAEAKRYAAWAGATTAKFHEARAITPAAPGIDQAIAAVESIQQYMRDDFQALPPEVFSLPQKAQRALVTLRGLADAPMRVHPRDAKEAVDYVVAHMLADSPKGGSESRDAVLAELVEAISAFKGKRGAFMALGAQDERTVRLWWALANAQAGDAEVPHG